jgi:uracil phosphoribosyltransferase
MLRLHSIEDRIVILIDPMLATGRSVIDSVDAFLRNGKPRHLHVVSLVAAPEGMEYLKQNLTVTFFTVDLCCGRETEPSVLYCSRAG